MKQYERRESVFAIVQEAGSVSIADLQSAFPDVSPVTLRRDLNYLDSRGLVKRTHGGARSVEVPDYSYETRASSGEKAKRVIAELAADFIEPGRSVFFDAGTTLFAFAKCVPNVELYGITNAPAVAIELARKAHIQVILLGGQLNKSSLSSSDLFATEMAQSLNIDVAFMGVAGCSITGGLSSPYFEESRLKAVVVQRAKRVIALLDSTKFGKSLPHTFAHIGDVEVMITDMLPDESILAEANKHGTAIVYRDTRP